MNAREAKQLRRLTYGMERRVEQREGGRVKVAPCHEPRRYRLEGRRTFRCVGLRADYQQAKKAA